jgi:hypothetical protein
MPNIGDIFTEITNSILPTIVRAIKLGRIRWAGHMACMGENINAYRVYVGNLQKRGHLEGLGIGKRMILKWILR